MPKYAYRCDCCQSEWTSWASVSLPIPTDCPECVQGTPSRIPPESLSTTKDTTQALKTGQLVEQAIIEAKEDLEKQAKELRKEDNDYF